MRPEIKGPGVFVPPGQLGGVHPDLRQQPAGAEGLLGAMIEVEPFSPAGVYDTLLELRLHDWAYEPEAEVLQRSLA